jgi:hypothetical protein
MWGCMYMWVCVYMSVCIYIYMWVYIYMCVCIYIYMCIYIYTHTHTHTHTHLHNIEGLVGQNKKKIGTAVNGTCHRFVSPDPFTTVTELSCLPIAQSFRHLLINGERAYRGWLMGKDTEGSAVACWVQCSSNSKTEETKPGPPAYKYVAITWNWQLNSIQYRAYKCVDVL